MKRLFSILGIALLTVAVGSASVVLSSNKEIKAAKADFSSTGLYERIEDPNEVTPGSKVILVTEGGYAFDGVGGNPAYAHGDPGGVTMFGPYSNEDYYDDWRNLYYSQDPTKFIWLEKQDVIVLNVEQGAEDTDPSYVSFSCNISVGGYNYGKHYLGENDEEGHGKNDYEAIQYFLDGFGVRKTKDKKSTWELTYDQAEKKMLIRKVLYDDDTSFICYNSYGVRHHLCFGSADSSHINLYKQVSNDDITKPLGVNNPHIDPNKTDYRLGDKINYNGMVVEFRINGANSTYHDYYLAFDNNTSICFSEPGTVTTGNTNIPVMVFGAVQYLIPISIISNSSNNVFTLRNSLSGDLRGTYLIKTLNDRILKGAQSTGTTYNYVDLSNTVHSDNSVTASDFDEYHRGEEIDQAIIRIVRTEIGGNIYYHAKNINDEYLCLGETINDYDERYVDYTSTASVNNAITMSASSIKIGNYYLNTPYYGTLRVICFTEHNDDSVSVYKLNESTSSIADEVNKYIAYFESKTEVCSNEDNPDFVKINDDLWNEIKTEFNKLSPDAQGIFASTTYTHGAEELKTKENVVDRYDYIISKYTSLSDFMNRKEANSYVNNYNASQNVFIKSIYEKTTPVTIVVVIIISLISIMTFGVLLIRRRKER